MPSYVGECRGTGIKEEVHCTINVPFKEGAMEGNSKRIAYVKDIFCLNLECQGQSETIVIPRGERRNTPANEE